MEAGCGKVRADAGELKRKPQKTASQAATLQVIVVSLALLLFKIDRGQFLSGVVEFGGQDAHHRIGLLALAAALFIKNLKRITFSNRLLQINIPGKNFR